MTTSPNPNDVPVLLGGQPARPTSPPGWPRDDEGVREVLDEISRSRDWGRYHGPNCGALIQGLSEFHGLDHVHLCSSGTAAVELALRGVAVSTQDEVILSAYDFKANFQNILAIGAVPVLVDVEPETWQLDATQIEQAITDRTRAILVSHLHGGCVDVMALRRLTESRGIAIIEDACQNPGAILGGRRSGTAGDVGVLSFGGSKLLTCGRGGCVMTSRPDVIERIRRYVHRGNDAYPLSEIQAAIVRPQLAKLDATNQQRRLAVQGLARRLNAVRGLVPLQLPTADLQTTYYKVGFRYEPAEFGGLTRDQFAVAMRAEGIAFDSGFRSLHLIHASRRFRAVGDLPVATRADEGMLVLHHPVLLESEAALDEIAFAVKKIRNWGSQLVEKADFNFVS